MLVKSCVGLLITLQIAYSLMGWFPIPAPWDLFAAVTFGVFMNNLFHWLVD